MLISLPLSHPRDNRVKKLKMNINIRNIGRVMQKETLLKQMNE